MRKAQGWDAVFIWDHVAYREPEWRPRRSRPHQRRSTRRPGLRSRDDGGDGGPGTNPEQLFAVGYGACSQSALLGVARAVASMHDSRIESTVGIGPSGEVGFVLQAWLDLHAPHLSPEDARELMARAHERCAYSIATRGNIEVVLMVDGQPI